MEPATIDAALLEGMFVRAIRPDEAFTAELRAAGFDLNRIVPRYPVSVWRKTLEIARRRLYSDRPEEEGYRALGSRFIEGYFETIIGKIVSVPLSLISPERIIQRIPKTWKTARSDVRIDPPLQEGPQRWRVHFHDELPIPGFFAGVVETASLRTTMRSRAKVAIERADARGFDLVITW